MYVALHVGCASLLASTGMTLCAQLIGVLHDYVFEDIQLEVLSAYSMQVYACQVVKCT